MLDFTQSQHNIALATEYYQRLRRLDETLPAELTHNQVRSFTNALDKVANGLYIELEHLRSQHHDLVTSVLLSAADDVHKSKLDYVEKLNSLIDEINMRIICSKIDPESSTLDLEGCSITRFPLHLLTHPEYSGYVEYFNQLKELNLNNNLLSILVLRDLPALQYLDCDDNRLHTIKLENLNALRDISLIDNEIQGSYDFTPFPNLYAIYLHNNKIESINVAELKKLEILDCSCNQLLLLQINSPKIRDLNCSHNCLLNLEIADVTQLELPKLGTPEEISGLHLYANALLEIPQNLIDKFGHEWSNNEMIDQLGLGFVPETIEPMVDVKSPANKNPEHEDFNSDKKDSNAISAQVKSEPTIEEKPAAMLIKYEDSVTRMRTRSQTKNESAGSKNDKKHSASMHDPVKRKARK